MQCEQAELRMAELLAGEIVPEERAGLEKHLLDCASCRGDFELARAGARVEWADVSVPKEVIDAALAAFREPAPLVRLLRWATAAAAVFGVAVLLLTSSRAANPTKTPAPPLAAVCAAERPQILATMQDAVVGALVCKDEDGRPVGELGLKSHEVTVEILDGIAKTTVEENFENHTSRRLEGTFNFPLPSDASISRLALEVNGKIEEGTCLERERALEVFDSIVRRMQDPALLEWQPGGFFKCRVFPIEPNATKRVIVAYTQALPCFQGKMTYVYPLASEKTRTHPPEELRIAVQARFSGALSKIESPSHHLDVQRKNAGEASMAFQAAHYRPNNDFVVTMEPGDEEVRVVSHKPDGEDGYFACFATPRGGGERAPGNYAFVLDVSASIGAPRLEVAKRLVRAMMERRIAGDRFEILAHNVEVERSGEVELRAANDFMDRLRPIGGSDVLKALLAGGDAEVIYIGKGAPSFGETDPAKILDAAKGRRIRTIAVGSDANGLLLEKLGGMMRVSPNDDVNKRVTEIAATLGSPVLTEVKIDGGDAVYDVVGVRDLFYGERLVVSGRYRGAAAKLAITGRGYRREVEASFPLKEEGNNYVRRLWAQRKVSDLLAAGAAKKPEVTELGVKYQIMTPYTSFLVLETEQMWKDHQLKREVQKQDQVLSAGDSCRSLFEDGTNFYKQGKFAEASAKFEEAFQRKPSSDQVYAFIKRSGEDMIGRMMNDPDRKMQDTGRRLMELAKPGLGLREGKVVVAKYVEDLKSDDHAVWRNSFWHLKNIGPSALTELMPALGDQANDRFRSRTMLMLTEMGTDAAPAVAEALKSRDPFIRQNAAIVLGNIRDGRSLAALKGKAEDPNETPEVKKFVADAIQKIARTPEVRAGKSSDLPDDVTLVPVVKPEVPGPVAKIPAPAVPSPAPREDNLSPRTKVASVESGKEDPKAKAIREAYEEQLRRDRQEVGGNFKDATIDEFRRQSGWNIVVDKKPLGDLGVATNQLGGIDFFLEDPTATTMAFKSIHGHFTLDHDIRDHPIDVMDIQLATASVTLDPVVEPEKMLKEMETRVVQVRQLPPPGVYTAKLEPGKTLMGAPLTPPGAIEDLTKRWELGRIVQDQLTKDVTGRPLGTMNFDPQSNVFIVRDTPEALERVARVLAAADRSAVGPGPAESLQQLLKLREEEELRDFEQRRKGVPFAAKEVEGGASPSEEWKELVSKRQPKGLSELRGDTNGENKVIADKLRSIRISPTYENAPLTAIVDHFREISGLNIHVTGIENPDAEMISIKAQDVTLDAALRKILEPRNQTYVVRDGVVLITRTGAILQLQSVSEDGTKALIAGNGAEVGRILAVTRDSKFVAMIRIDRVNGSEGLARVLQGLSVGRILPGDTVTRVLDLGSYLAALPVEVRTDLASRTSQQAMRAKMGLKE